MAKKSINTMEQLAVEIGVSRPTLSKYFHDPSSVRRSTRLRIEELIATVDYVPNFFARNMNRKQTNLFGVVLPQLDDFFYMTLLREIERRAEALDVAILIQNSHSEPARELQVLRTLRAMNVEGLMVSPIGAKANAPAFRALAAELPLVLMDARMPKIGKKIPFVGTDNRQSVGLLVDYLCRSGSAPKFLTMRETTTNAAEREEIYRTRMTELGFTPEVLTGQRGEGAWDMETYAYALTRSAIAGGLGRGDTLLCESDRLAIGALRAANEAGLTGVGLAGKDRLRIAGHDGHPFSQYVWPSITTASQDIRQIAVAAVNTVYGLARNPSDAGVVVAERLFPAQLCLRDSA